jgi:hypothetical protein
VTPRRLEAIDSAGELCLYADDEAPLGAALSSRCALKADKAETRDDALVATKDRADLATLARVG